MAKFVFKDAAVIVNAVDLSDHVKSVEVNVSREDVDVTAMGASGHERQAGLGDDSITVTWLQDFAASEVDATLFPLVGAAAFTVAVRPTSSATSSTNPGFSGSCILTEYQPLGGEVGSAAEASTTFTVSGVVSRATS